MINFRQKFAYDKRDCYMAIVLKALQIHETARKKAFFFNLLKCFNRKYIECQNKTDTKNISCIHWLSSIVLL